MTDQQFISATSNVKLQLTTDDDARVITLRTLYHDDAMAFDCDPTQAAAIITQLTAWLAARARQVGYRAIGGMGG